MMKRRGFAWAASLWLATAATGAHAAQEAAKPCVPTVEAEALFLLIAPELLRSAGAGCAAVLPAGSLLRSPSPAFLAKYESEVDGAWPLAKEAIVKISGPEARAAMESEAAKPLVISMMAPLLVGKIKPADCGAIERVLGYLEPLPARSMSGLLVTIAEIAQRDKPKGQGGGPSLDICPPAPR